MVVVNTMIGLLFKFPTCILTILNILAYYLYKNFYMYNYFYMGRLHLSLKFSTFYIFLVSSGFLDTFYDLSEWLYVVSISIVLMVYLKFDKKFSKGYDSLVAKKVKK